MLTPNDISGFADKLADATMRTVLDLTLGEIRHEEPFSDELCGRLKETLHDFETETIRWQIQTAAGDKGKGRFSANSLSKYTEEPVFGADLVMVLDVATQDYSIRKGFLVQSKLLEPGQNLSESEHFKLVSQCRRMLQVSQHAFVFLYCSKGIKPVSAQTVVAANGKNLFDQPSYDIRTVFADFALCWVGDTNIEATDRASLERLRTRVDAADAVHIAGRQREEPSPHVRKGTPVKQT